MQEPKGYWSSVFYQATALMRQRPSLDGEAAFWMARDMIDRNLTGEKGDRPSLPLSPRGSEDLVLAA